MKDFFGAKNLRQSNAMKHFTTFTKSVYRIARKEQLAEMDANDLLELREERKKAEKGWHAFSILTDFYGTSC